MTDSAIQNAKSRRDKLASEINAMQEKIAEWKREMARVDQFIADWNAFAGVEDVTESKIKPSPKAQNPSREVVARAVTSILRSNQGPITRKDLFRALSAQGVTITGKDPEMVLSTMMWRLQDEFVRIPSFGYWFRGLPCPAANYKPGDIPDTRTKDADEREDAHEDLVG